MGQDRLGCAFGTWSKVTVRGQPKKKRSLKGSQTGCPKHRGACVALHFVIRIGQGEKSKHLEPHRPWIDDENEQRDSLRKLECKLYN